MLLAQPEATTVDVTIAVVTVHTNVDLSTIALVYGVFGKAAAQTHSNKPPLLCCSNRSAQLWERC